MEKQEAVQSGHQREAYFIHWQSKMWPSASVFSNFVPRGGENTYTNYSSFAIFIGYGVLLCMVQMTVNRAADFYFEGGSI